MAKPEQVNVVRQWTSSPILYGADSRDKQTNPDYHPTIGLTDKGKFVDEMNRPVPESKVPAYIKAEARTTDRNTKFVPPAQRQLSMADAMLASGVPETDPDPAVRAKRGRPRLN